MAGLLIPAAGADPISATLRRWAAEPFVWGQTDCVQCVLDHIELLTGEALPERPRYTNSHAAALFIARRGGFEEAARDLAAAYGFAAVGAAARGDAGLVDLPGSGPTLCLCLGAGCWAAKGDCETVIFSGLDPIVAWRLPCPRQ